MNGKTIGNGLRRETSDPALVAKAVEKREQLGLGEEVRVEELSKVEHLKLQLDKATLEKTMADGAMDAAAERADKAWKAWLAAHDAYAAAVKEEKAGG